MHRYLRPPRTAAADTHTGTGGTLATSGAASDLTLFWSDVSYLHASVTLHLERQVTGKSSVPTSAANRLIGEVVQSQRRPLLGPSPG